ncbi:MAG: alpha/beta hydrolase [Oscillospiraceae bacterium]|nr:alpha/beta hydrolase [Oscillospiraceae bacterium]
MVKKKWWILPAILLLILVIAFFVFVADYYHATDTAIKALESDNVLIKQTEYGWFFDGPSSDRALIFYPGAKVEETAYAPLLHRLSDSDIDVCLVKMPFHMALFGKNTASRIMKQYEYKQWYIGGHSLGGAVAANYAAAHDLDGVILLAAFPTKDVDEPMLLIYGSEDGVLNQERVAAADRFGTVKEIVIDGGNHAGFGEYGEQAGDNPADISTEEQIQITVDAISKWLS